MTITTVSSSAKEGQKRIVGYDFARALAVFGMVFVNFRIVMGANGNGVDWLDWLVGLLEGRAAATFVVLAGVGLSLLTQRACLSRDIVTLVQNRYLLLKRALFLLIVGLLYSPLWPADILHFYGLYIAICAFLLTVSNQRLWLLASIFTFGFLLLLIVFDYETGWNWDTLEYAGFWTPLGMIRHMFFNGFHPVFPWTAFMLVGMWLGRQDMKNPELRKRILLISILIVGLTEVTSWSLIQFFSGNASTGELELIIALFGTAPMPPMPFYLFSGGGIAIVVITLSIILTEKFALSKWIKPLIATGQLALTNYFAHVIIGMGTLEAFGLLHDQSMTVSVYCSLGFCIVMIFFSSFWRSQFKRGPLEWLMRNVTG